MVASPAIRKGLRHIGRMAEDQVDVAEAGLLLAALSRPGVALAPYRRHLEKVAAEVREYAGSDGDRLDMRAEALRRVIAKRHGYGGDEEGLESTDGTAADLIRTIDDRHGLPAMLAIVYIHAGRFCGWNIEAVDFPARVLVRLEGEGRRLMLDPFDGGRPVEPAGLRGMVKAVIGNHAELIPAYYRSLGNRGLLLRAEQTVKMRHLRNECLAEALEVVEASLLFAPDEAGLWREAGLLHARLDNVQAAVVALEEYMRRNAGDSSRFRTSILLQELRARL